MLLLRNRKRYVGKRRSVRGDDASRVDQACRPSHSAGWLLADSLQLLEDHYGGGRDEQVIDLAQFDQEPAATSGSAQRQGTALKDIVGVGPATAGVLVAHGFTEVRSVAAAGVADLTRVPGFGTTRAAAVKAAAELLTTP